MEWLPAFKRDDEGHVTHVKAWVVYLFLLTVWGIVACDLIACVGLLAHWLRAVR